MNLKTDMNKILLTVVLVIIGACNMQAQKWQIEVRDNLGRMNMEQGYRLTPDSLFITGKSDYGRTNVNYLQRKLTAKEHKLITDFILKFPVDSLKEVYFNEYTNYKYIDEDHFPRSFDVIIQLDDKSYVSKATNAWVGLYLRLFDFLNPVFPPEVRIVVDKSQFNVFY